MSEIIFEVQEDEVDGGYVATALGHGIVTQGDTLNELREMVKDAVHCHFGDGVPGPMPKIIRLHFVRDEVMEGIRGRQCWRSLDGLAGARIVLDLWDARG